MKRLIRKRWVKVAIAITFVAFILYSLFPIILFSFGSFLVVNDPLIKTNAIVVVGGGRKGERLEEGIRLFKEGYGKALILSGGLITVDTSEVDFWKKKACASGIPGDKIFLHRGERSQPLT